MARDRYAQPGYASLLCVTEVAVYLFARGLPDVPWSTFAAIHLLVFQLVFPLGFAVGVLYQLIF